MKYFNLTLVIFFCLPVLINYCNSNNLSDGIDNNNLLRGKKISIIPKPVKIEEKEGEFIIKPDTKIFYEVKNKEIDFIISYLSDFIKRISGEKIKIEKFSGKTLPENAILLTSKYADKALGDEGYKLDITPKLVLITALKPAGLFYGVQTIRQLLPPEVENLKGADKYIDLKLPCLRIEDKPRFSWRGMMLDVSRHFFPKAFVKQYIDYLAMHKMNKFHWHLCDDQGWRLEIKKYPKLAEISAWRVDKESQPWNARDKQKPDEKATYGGFYTQKDVREIVQYAKERFITIVPEIEMPAHVTAALAAYPNLSCTGGPFTVPPGGLWPLTDIYCAGNDSTFIFLQDVLTEVIDLFPGKYIHIGGDEATKTEWEKCPKCKERVKKENLKDFNELQSYFVKRIEKFLISKNRKLIGWDEILEGGLAPEATVMSWRGTKGGIEAAKQKHDVVMTPTSNCYFDYYQGNQLLEPPAIGGFLPLKKVYDFEPVPDELSSEEAKYILGGQANLWTEYIPTAEHATYMVLPRMDALSECVWSPKEKKNWDDFIERLIIQLKRYDILNLNYAKSAFNVNLELLDATPENILFKLFSEVNRFPIHYTLDGSEPNSKSTKFENHIKINKTTTLKAASFFDNKIISKISEQKLFFHKATGRKVELKNKYNNNYRGGGDFGLVNGMKGSENLSDGIWQGYLKDDLFATIDLGDTISINKISTSYLQNLSSWVFPPTEIDYSISKDGKNYKSIAKFTNEISQDMKDIIIRNYEKQFPAEIVRYVQINAKNVGICPAWHGGAGNNAWLFIDEIIVE